MEDEEDEEEDEGRDDEEDVGGSVGEDEDASSFAGKWHYIILVDQVSEVTRLPWPEVFFMEIGEFLNIVCYLRDKAEHQKRQYDKLNHRH